MRHLARVTSYVITHEIIVQKTYINTVSDTISVHANIPQLGCSHTHDAPILGNENRTIDGEV